MPSLDSGKTWRAGARVAIAAATFLLLVNRACNGKRIHDTTETLLRGCKLEGLHPLLIVTYKEYTISVDKITVPHNERVTVRCRELGKYKFIGDPLLHCRNGTWNGKLPNCVPTTAISNYTGSILHLECLFARKLGNPEWTWTSTFRGYLTGWAIAARERDWKYRLSIYYAKPHNSGVYTCTTPKGLSNSIRVRVIDVQCSVLTVPEPPLISRIEGSRMGHSAIFECPMGYRLEGASGITCQYNGKWSADVPRCQEIECPSMDDTPENALLQLVEYNNTFGGFAVFTCMWGHKLSGSQSLRCEGDGRWNGSMPTCLEITCPVPEIPRSGRIVEQTRYSNKKQYHGRIYKVGALVRFACLPGHQLIGEASIICTENGTWSHRQPVCKVRCPYPGDPPHGRIAPLKFWYKPGDNIQVSTFEQWIKRSIYNYVQKCELPGPDCEICTTRDKKLQLSQATKLRSTVSRKLASLEVDIKSHREVIKDLSAGGKLSLLGEHKKFCLAVRQLQPPEIYAAAYQDCDVKRRFLDRLYLEKKKKLKHAIELQLEYSDLSNECEAENDDRSHCEQQQLVAQLQRSISKYNAAKAIHSTYFSMLNILKKDAMFFDILLSMLKEDQFFQCKAMLRVTIMGQLAAENLDDIRQKYKRMTRVILYNMRVREQMLNNVRCQVQDLWTYALSLMRVESDTVFVRKDIVRPADELLGKQLIHLEDICDQVKESLLVRSYHDLLSRLETQSKQKTDLLARLNINIKSRDSLLSETNHAVHVLENLKHSKTAAEEFKTYECEILEKIENEKKREKNLKELKKTCGELLTNVRAALQSINTVLLYVKEPGKVTKKAGKDVGKDILKEIDDKAVDEVESLAELEEVDTDVLMLLAKIARKIHILFNMSNFDLEKEKEDRARNLYQTYVSNFSSNLIFGSGEEEPIGLFVEHEIIDATVPTRVDIKLHSKQILEVHLKPE